jgi:hypothetical protein
MMSKYKVLLFDRNIVPLERNPVPTTEPGCTIEAESFEEAKQIVNDNRDKYERLKIYKADDMSKPIECITSDKGKI